MFEHVAACFDQSFCDNPETGALLRSASLVIGMHPDEATEAIVTHSLAQNKK